MEGTMRAMDLDEPGKLVLKQVPIPKPGPRDVLLKVIYAGICGTPPPERARTDPLPKAHREQPQPPAYQTGSCAPPALY